MRVSPKSVFWQEGVQGVAKWPQSCMSWSPLPGAQQALGALLWPPGFGEQLCRPPPPSSCGIIWGITRGIILPRGSTDPACCWSARGLGLRIELRAGSGCGGQAGGKFGPGNGRFRCAGLAPKRLSESRRSLLERRALTWGCERLSMSSSHPGDVRVLLFALPHAPKGQGLLPQAWDVAGNQVCAHSKDGGASLEPHGGTGR